MGPYAVVSCGGNTGCQHIVIRSKVDGGLNDRTLCGRRWSFKTKSQFQAQYDCQSCRKQQEDRA